MLVHGRSDYGHALEVFAERYGDAIGPKTSLLILGDARSNYQPPALETLQAPERRRPARLLAQPRADRPSGTPATRWRPRYGGIVPMHECRNVAQLAAFIEELA